MPRAGRVHPDFEGRKVLKHLKEYVRDWGKAKGARTEVFTVFDSNKKVHKLLCTRVRKRLLCIFIVKGYLLVVRGSLRKSVAWHHNSTLR